MKRNFSRVLFASAAMAIGLLSFGCAKSVGSGALPQNPRSPVLGETGRFVVLASQAVTTTGTTLVSDGDMGIKDVARSSFAGFTAGASAGLYDQLVNGLSYAHDDTDPALIPAPYASTIAFLNQVRTDMSAADTFLGADPNPDAPTQVCATELGSSTLYRGVYKTASSVTIQTGDLTLDAQGDPDSVWIFVIAGTLTTAAPGGNIILANGAKAKNIYWRTAGNAIIAGEKSFVGNVFAAPTVTVGNAAVISGRLFAMTNAVTLIGDSITKGQ
jgi:trimeric autotransporter adhesin